jgi:pilus assembly protein Flp/PilA
MQGVKQLARRFAQDTGGATAIEYGLIAAMTCIIAVVGMTALGGGVAQVWTSIATRVAAAIGG